MPTLYVIRHAEPKIRDVISGQSDPPLSITGRDQAELLRVPVNIVYSSPLKRARQTAIYLNSCPVILSDLAEISYGAWDGLSWSEIERRWPEIAAAKIADWQGITPPGGEPWDRFSRRVEGCLTGILAGPLPAAVVAHEAVNAVIAKRLTGNPVDKYKQQYCEIRKYDLRSESIP